MRYLDGGKGNGAMLPQWVAMMGSARSLVGG